MSAGIHTCKVTGGDAVKQFSTVSVAAAGTTISVEGIEGMVAFLGYSGSMTLGTAVATDGIPVRVGESRFFPADDLANLNALYVGVQGPIGLTLTLTSQES